MAHIVYRPAPDGLPAKELIINGHNFSSEAYDTVELVSVGEDEYAEVGFQVTFAVSRLDLCGDEDVQVTDHFHGVAQRVRSMQAASE